MPLYECTVLQNVKFVFVWICFILLTRLICATPECLSLKWWIFLGTFCFSVKRSLRLNVGFKQSGLAMSYLSVISYTSWYFVTCRYGWNSVKKITRIIPWPTWPIHCCYGEIQKPTTTKLDKNFTRNIVICSFSCMYHFVFIS